MLNTIGTNPYDVLDVPSSFLLDVPEGKVPGDKLNANFCGLSFKYKIPREARGMKKITVLIDNLPVEIQACLEKVFHRRMNGLKNKLDEKMSTAKIAHDAQLRNVMDASCGYSAWLEKKKSVSHTYKVVHLQIPLGISSGDSFLANNPVDGKTYKIVVPSDKKSCELLEISRSRVEDKELFSLFMKQNEILINSESATVPQTLLKTQPQYPKLQPPLKPQPQQEASLPQQNQLQQNQLQQRSILHPHEIQQSQVIDLTGDPSFLRYRGGKKSNSFQQQQQQRPKDLKDKKKRKSCSEWPKDAKKKLKEVHGQKSPSAPQQPLPPAPQQIQKQQQQQQQQQPIPQQIQKQKQQKQQQQQKQQIQKQKQQQPPPQQIQKQKQPPPQQIQKQKQQQKKQQEPPPQQIQKQQQQQKQQPPPPPQQQIQKQQQQQPPPQQIQKPKQQKQQKQQQQQQPPPQQVQQQKQQKQHLTQPSPPQRQKQQQQQQQQSKQSQTQEKQKQQQQQHQHQSKQSQTQTQTQEKHFFLATIPENAKPGGKFIAELNDRDRFTVQVPLNNNPGDKVKVEFLCSKEKWEMMNKRTT